MELSTTTRGKAKLLWNGYTKHTEKNDMIRWHCTCHASKLCPANAYTDLLPAYPELKIDHNHCPEPMKLEVIVLKKYAFIEYLLVLPKCHATKCTLPRCPIIKMSYYRNVQLPKCPVTKMSCDRNVLLPKCQLPKRPLPKCPLPKCLDTLNWILF